MPPKVPSVVSTSLAQKLFLRGSHAQHRKTHHPASHIESASRSRIQGHLKHKTAFITGASRGIGRAIAERFAAEGARCILAGRSESSLRSVLASLPNRSSAGASVGSSQKARDGRAMARGEHEQEQVQEDEDEDSPGEHEIAVGDVREGEFWSDVKRTFNSRSKKKIDVLVNAAGVTHYSPFLITSEEKIGEVLDTNLRGAVLGCKSVGKVMLGAGGGCIINVASLLGVKGGRGSAVYAASKAGLIGLTRALAAELGPSDIRVNVILPGYIKTDMTDVMTPQARTDSLNAIPSSPSRFGEPSEIADAAVFLANNRYANNCVVNLDGGLSAV